MTQRLQAGLGTAPFDIPGFEQTRDGTPLAVRCLVVDDGATRMAIVSATCLLLSGEAADMVRDAVCAAAGLARDRVLVATTHVHSGPPMITSDHDKRLTYARHIADAAARAARAAATTQPARVGYETARLEGVSRVRRVLRRDGSVITLRRAWPQYWGAATDPETVGPEEPLDDLLTVVRVEDLDGRAMGAVMHFTCHPIPDYFGYAARLVEANVPGCVCLILNGCFGSVDSPFEVPMRGKTQADQLPILGDILGYRTLELLARAETTDRVALGAASVPVFLPLDSRCLADPARLGPLLGEAIERGGVDADVQCLRIGELAFVGIPGEAQVGFARDIQEASPVTLTRPIGNADRSCAYLLKEESRARGGYEADATTWGLVTGQGLVNILAAAKSGLARLAAGPCCAG